jgi:outer membrane lipoprotein-sorting protein
VKKDFRNLGVPLVAVCLIFSAITWRASAQLLPPKKIELTANSGIDDILQALYARGQNLQDFTADVNKSDVDTVRDKEIGNIGKVYYRRQPDGKVQIRVTFEHKKYGDSKPIPFHQDMLLAGNILIIQKYDQNLEQHLQIAQPGQQVNPIKLGEGTFPLPIGQDPTEVKKQFDVKLVPHDKDDPPHTIHAELTPKPGTHLAKRFMKIGVWVDMETNFTPRIEGVDTNGVQVETTDLTNLKINSGLKDADFQLPPPPTDWSVKTEDFQD